MAYRAVPEKELPGGLQAVPNVAADLITVDSTVFQVVLNNISAAGTTVTIKDKQSTPLALIGGATGLTVSPGVPQVFNFPQGVLMKSGINWVAGAANAIVAEIFGYQHS